MHSALSVDTCVTIRRGCPMEYVICGDRVEFSYGGPGNGFHFAYDADSLRELTRLGAEALAELEARATASGVSAWDERAVVATAR